MRVEWRCFVYRSVQSFYAAAWTDTWRWLDYVDVDPVLSCTYPPVKTVKNNCYFLEASPDIIHEKEERVAVMTGSLRKCFLLENDSRIESVV